MTDQADILVFKTNIHTEEDLLRIASVLDEHSGIAYWSVDRSDADKVLRVGSASLQSPEIKELTGQAGFLCEELPD